MYKSGIFEGNVFLQEDYDIESEDSSIDLSDIYKSKFKNLKGYEFTVAGLAYAPFLMKNQGEKFSGYEILQLNALAEHLKFKLKIIELPDGLIPYVKAVYSSRFGKEKVLPSSYLSMVWLINQMGYSIKLWTRVFFSSFHGFPQRWLD